MSYSRVASLLIVLALFAVVDRASGQVVNSQWNVLVGGGNGNWNVATNWTPNAIPDNGGGFTYNVQIGNLAPMNAQVTFIPEDGTSDLVSSLDITDAADLFTNGFQILVIAQTTIDGLGSTIRVDPHATPGTVGFQTLDLDLNNGGALVMNGGFAAVTRVFEINAGSVLSGFGTVNLGDFDFVVEQAFENSGLIQVAGTTLTPGTLTLHANASDVIDLDGTTETGVVDVANVTVDVELDTLTLVVDGPLSDAFSGTLQIGQRDTATFNDNFTMSGADVQMDGGTQTATMNGPGDVTSITSSAFTVTGNAVIENDLTFSGVANSLTTANASTLTLGGTVAVVDASMFVFGQNSFFVVDGATSITEAAGDFDWDGGGAVTTTVNGLGNLALAVDQIDVGNDIYNGTLNLNDGGDASVNNTANGWTLGGTLNKNGASVSTISGEALNVTGAINAGGTGTLDLPTTTLSSTANVNVTSRLTLGGASVLAGPAVLTGTGELEMEGTSTVSANTTVNVATFDWDGLGTGTTHTINDGVVFTINSATFDSDGDMDDPINLGGNGSQLLVNGSTEWAMNGTFTANSAAAGTATVGGTSRLVLQSTMNVDGNTNVIAPITFGAGSTTSIDAAMTLNVFDTATYNGASISGAGTFNPAATNTVTGNTTINVTNFDFDAGNWTVQDGALLTINVGDYDPLVVPNSFDSTITLNGGDVSVFTSDAAFVMDGTLNFNSTVGTVSFLTGESVQIGNDAGALDADVNVTGNITTASQFGSPVTFNSDADVNIPSGGVLQFTTASTVTFNTVNGLNNAEFTGDGRIEFNGVVNVNEAVTLNMVGGVVNLDGTDPVGEFINIDAPLTINVEFLSSFGKANIAGINTLDVNNSVGTGVLTVNLDDPADEWTLNAPGVMNLVNDIAPATLLAGSDVNVNGTVNVTGDVTTTARVDIAGAVNINTGGEPFRLAGGSLADPNTLAGGTINGPGILAANAARALAGFGVINSNIDFDGASELVAQDGLLDLNGTITDLGTLRTNGVAAIVDFATPFTTNVTDSGILMAAGTVQGATVTTVVTKPLRGFGTVTSAIDNNGVVEAQSAGTLILNNTASDWDGTAGGIGQLRATGGGVLDIRDNATFGFIGDVIASGGGRVFANGFALDFNAGSVIDLTGATYESTHSTDIGGTVTVGVGADSTLQVTNNFFLTFETGSATTLNGNLRTVNNNVNVEAGATFSGGGALIVPDGSHMVADNLANIGVLLDMQGGFRPGNSEGIGRIDLFDYQQGNTGELFVELTGTSLNAFDRLVVSGDVVLDGYLNVDIDGGFVPALGNTFNIITGNTVSGEFDFADVSGMPMGLTFHIEYLGNAVQLQVVNTPFFSADFDEDGDVDATDLAIWQGAFNLNQLGDADGDNDSDGNDFLLWQQQLGSIPAVPVAAAVPEPTTLLLSLLALVALAQRRN